MSPHSRALAPRPRVAFVLAGGAALGAYEVGVVRYLLEQLASDPGSPVELSILSGTSAGALNVSFLAAHADAGRERARSLGELWTTLRLRSVLRPSGLEILGMLLQGRAQLLSPPLRALRGGMLDSRPLEALFRRAAKLEHIEDHLRAGLLHAVTVSATHVASGRCISFVQTHSPLDELAVDPLLPLVAARLDARHVLASAAIPLVFPAVVIDGEAYCDGGLRQVVPLSPALHLGADAIVVINPLVASRHGVGTPPVPIDSLISPVYLAGKALNALLLDRMEVDLLRLAQLNDVLAAGERRWGPGFGEQLNRELTAHGGRPVRSVHLLRLQPSRDIGSMAAEFIASPEFARRECNLSGQILRLIGRGDPAHAGDLLSYLLFDGEFAHQLIELGWSDTQTRHLELRTFFASISGRSRQ